jgi:hypothetical protein
MKLLKTLDFLGTSPYFFVEGSGNSKSTLGGILSILVSFVVLAGCSYFFNLLFSRSKYSVIQNEEYFPEAFRYWHSDDVSFKILNRTFGHIPDGDRLFDVTGQWWKSTNLKLADGSKYDSLYIEDFKLEKCDVNYHMNNTRDLWENQKYIDTSYCLPKNKILNSSRVFASENYTGTVMWFHRCVNTTTKNDCYPIETINTLLENIFIQVKIKDYYFDHKLIGNTGIPYIYTDIQQVSSTAYKRIWYHFRELTYNTDIGYIFPETELNIYNNLAQTTTSTDIRTKTTVPGSFGAVSLNMYGMRMNYNKSYYKAQNMLADMGGILKGLISLAAVLNYYTSMKLYYLTIITQNIGFLIHNQPKTNKKLVPESPRKEKKELNPEKIHDTEQINLSPPSHDVKSILKNRNNVNKSEMKSIEAKSITFSPTSKRNPQSLSASYSDKIKTTKKKFSLKEILCAPCCLASKASSKNNAILFARLQQRVKEDLDISNLISKLNTVDLINFIIFGKPKPEFVKNFINPRYLRDEQEIPDKLIELRNQVIKGLTN